MHHLPITISLGFILTSPIWLCFVPLAGLPFALLLLLAAGAVANAYFP